MKIGIDLLDLQPKMNQGINVYSENLVKGFYEIKGDFKLQIYVNNEYYAYALNTFRSKKIKIISYNRAHRLKHIIIKLLIFSFSFLNFKSLTFFALIRNLLFNDFKKLVEKNSDILISPNVVLNHYNFNIKTLLCIHDIQHTYLPENFSKFENLMRYHTRNNSVKYCDNLITSSLFLKKQCNKFFNKKNSLIKVIDEGVNLKVFKKKNYNNKKINNFKLPKKFVFYPAGFWPHKNHLLLLEAIKNLKNQGKKINLVLCGSKKKLYKRVINFIKINKLSNVICLGTVSEKNVIKAYNLCTAVVMPSIEESSSLLLKETIAVGKPFLGSNTKTFLEKNKEFSFKIFNIRKKFDLEKNLVDIYFNNLKFKKKISKNSKLIKNYNWKNVAKKFYTTTINLK